MKESDLRHHPLLLALVMVSVMLQLIGKIDNGRIDNGKIDNGKIDNGRTDNGYCLVVESLMIGGLV